MSGSRQKMVKGWEGAKEREKDREVSLDDAESIGRTVADTVSDSDISGDLCYRHRDVQWRVKHEIKCDLVTSIGEVDVYDLYRFAVGYRAGRQY
ncbi:MAG: hypothetical protein J7J06_06975, partial [Methanosarcinales archaeon]|nr:hypothetical protein [Methanosarcinales archaeon]